MVARGAAHGAGAVMEAVGANIYLFLTADITNSVGAPVVIAQSSAVGDTASRTGFGISAVCGIPAVEAIGAVAYRAADAVTVGVKAMRNRGSFRIAADAAVGGSGTSGAVPNMESFIAAVLAADGAGAVDIVVHACIALFFSALGTITTHEVMSVRRCISRSCAALGAVHGLRTIQTLPIMMTIVASVHAAIMAHIVDPIVGAGCAGCFSTNRADEIRAKAVTGLLALGGIHITAQHANTVGSELVVTHFGGIDKAAVHTLCLVIAGTEVPGMGVIPLALPLTAGGALTVHKIMGAGGSAGRAANGANIVRTAGDRFKNMAHKIAVLAEAEGTFVIFKGMSYGRAVRLVAVIALRTIGVVTSGLSSCVAAAGAGLGLCAGSRRIGVTQFHAHIPAADLTERVVHTVDPLMIGGCAGSSAAECTRRRIDTLPGMISITASSSAAGKAGSGGHVPIMGQLHLVIILHDHTAVMAGLLTVPHGGAGRRMVNIGTLTVLNAPFTELVFQIIRPALGRAGPDTLYAGQGQSIYTESRHRAIE